ncbi:hypothetical protein [Pseudomonas citronellolis]|uniref:hypothetical protein n=1 Tax=Pseudomonas citronellolis TaxID=53408 RepID=UPI00248EEB98|nr:hypothetical protein [Pseudomonas citronellolis]
MSNENRQGLSAQGERCTSCDGTGDLTRPDGEWVGYCVCPEGEALKASTALAPELDDQVFKAQRDRLAEVLADLVISSDIDIGDCSLQAGPDLIELAMDLKKRLAALIAAAQPSPVPELARPLDATHYLPGAPEDRKYRREIDGVWHEFCGRRWLPLDHGIPEQYIPLPALPERGTQHRFSAIEQTCRHDFGGGVVERQRRHQDRPRVPALRILRGGRGPGAGAAGGGGLA